MKRLVLVAALLLSGGAYAQPPEELTADDTIELQVGQTRTFTFDQSVREFILVTDGIAKVTPRNDRTFSIEALNPGQVLAIASASDGREIHRMNIAVAGHMVKIYGYSRDETKDYIGYLCTETGCGRADPDTAQPGSQSTAVTKRNRNGDLVTTTKNYP
jgi:hypothetical protein